MDLISKFSLEVFIVVGIVIRKVRRLQQYFLTIIFFAKKKCFLENVKLDRGNNKVHDAKVASKRTSACGCVTCVVHLLHDRVREHDNDNDRFSNNETFLHIPSQHFISAFGIAAVL